MQNTCKSIFSLFILFLYLTSSAYTTEIKKINVGYFEAGQYDVHSILRDEYFNQLETLLPDSLQIIAIPEGYRSADWNRSTSKTMALELTQVKNLDYIIAIGPWVVQDLLEAGFDKPIIGMHQFNPKAEGLLKENDRPIADNLTVHFRPGKTLDDLRVLTKVIPIKRLGVLSFPADDTTHTLHNHIKSLGSQNDIKVFTATEYDKEGTFAFYKSYNILKQKHVDAIYLGPLWGLSSQELMNFFEMLNREKVPTFTDEGALLIQQGATLTNNFYGLVSEAYYNAYKTIKILDGATPADLPVIFRSSSHIGINKQSANLCEIEMRADIFNSYSIIGVEDNSNITPSALNELVNRAVNLNPDILSQLDLINASNAQIKIAKSTYKPQVFGNVAFDLTDNNFHHNYQYSIEKEIFRSSLNVTQTLFSKEKLKEIQIAKDNNEITKISRLANQLDLEHAVSLAYLDYLKLQEQGFVIKNTSQMLSYILELLHAKAIIHNSDSLDFLRFENLRYQFTLAYIENNQLLKTAQVLLNSLLNLPPDEKIILQSEYFSEEQFIQFESPIIEKLRTHSDQETIGKTLLNKMLIQNPSQLKSDATIAYRKSILEKNKASFYPEVQLHGSLLYDNFQTKTEFFQEKNPSWYIGAKVNLPLFLGGKRFQEKKKAYSLLSDAEYKKDVTSLNTLKNGLSSYYQFVQYTEQMTPAFQSNLRASSAIEIANTQLNFGKVSTTDYLEILQSGFQTNLKLINIRYNYFASMANIIHDLGIPVSDSFSDFVNIFHEELEY